MGAPQRVKGHLEVTLFIQKKRKDLIPGVAVATGTNRTPPQSIKALTVEIHFSLTRQSFVGVPGPRETVLHAVIPGPGFLPSCSSATASGLWFSSFTRVKGKEKM